MLKAWFFWIGFFAMSSNVVSFGASRSFWRKFSFLRIFRNYIVDGIVSNLQTYIIKRVHLPARGLTRLVKIWKYSYKWSEPSQSNKAKNVTNKDPQRWGQKIIRIFPVPAQKRNLTPDYHFRWAEAVAREVQEQRAAHRRRHLPHPHRLCKLCHHRSVIDTIRIVPPPPPPSLSPPVLTLSS